VIKKPWWAAAFAAALVLMAGCHNGGHSQNSTDLRALNAVIDAEPLDLLVDDDVKLSGIALGTTSPVSEFDSGTRNVKIRSSTSSSVLAEKSIALNSGAVNTLVMYGKRGSIGTFLLQDSTNSPSSGKFRVRGVGLSGDSGAVDLYVVADPVNNVAATIPSVAYLSATAYSELSPGSFAITMTTAGTKEILFQSSPQAFSDGASYTIGVFPSAGGKLVSAWMLKEGGDGTYLVNPVARIKVVNAIADSPTLNFKADGTSLLSNVPFAGSSSYVSLATGNRTLQLEAANVPGTIIASSPQAIASAHDYTVLALDSFAAPRLAMVSDDNTFPTAGFAKVRFVNALSGTASVDVLVNFASQAAGLAYGGTSAYSQLAANTAASTGYTITFSTPGGVSVIATLADVQLDSGVVYTAILLGPANAPQVKLVRDR
jgi:hypothetical protein